MKRLILICFLIFGLVTSVSAISLIGSGIVSAPSCTTIVDSRTDGASDALFAYNAGSLYRATRFYTSEAHTVCKVDVELKKIGTPTGINFTLAIWSDVAGPDPGSAITNGTAQESILATDLTTSYAWYSFTFATNPSVSASTYYWIVLQADSEIDSSNCPAWNNNEATGDNQQIMAIDADGAGEWTTATSRQGNFKTYK